jgi:hypothetical protein
MKKLLFGFGILVMLFATATISSCGDAESTDEKSELQEEIVAVANNITSIPNPNNNLIIRTFCVYGNWGFCSNYFSY